MGCGSGCGCAPCGDPARPALVDRAFRGDPSARALLALEGGGPAVQIGDWLPKLVGPADVRRLKERLQPSMLATNAAVKTCTALSTGEREAWRIWFAAWSVWYATPEPWLFGASNEYDETQVYEAQLAAWQEQLRQKCTIPGPVVKDETTLDLSGLKWVAGAIIVGAVAYTIGPLVRSLKK